MSAWGFTQKKKENAFRAGLGASGTKEYGPSPRAREEADKYLKCAWQAGSKEGMRDRLQSLRVSQRNAPAPTPALQRPAAAAAAEFTIAGAAGSEDQPPDPNVALSKHAGPH